MANAGASHISMEFGVTGPAFTLSTACSSSNHALGMALQLLRAGTADMVLAGGSEAPMSFGLLKAWEAMRVVAPDTCRPFCKDRHGIILGEGAGMLVLEPLDAARARGAHIYAELAGCGMSADASHITQPTVVGPVRAIRAALADAAMPLDEVGHINAHGTGTSGNDPAETRAIREVFGALADGVPVSSTKSMHGHALERRRWRKQHGRPLQLASARKSPASRTAKNTEADLSVRDLGLHSQRRPPSENPRRALQLLRFRRTKRRRRFPRRFNLIPVKIKTARNRFSSPSKSKNFLALRAYALFAYQSELIAVKFAHFSGKSSSA